MIPWWVKWIGLGAVVVGLLWVGDTYGFNARNYAECQAETARRNAGVAASNATENKLHAEEQTKAAAARAAFDKASKGIGQCLLTGNQAAALNGIGE
jgi:hypothetical protein